MYARVVRFTEVDQDRFGALVERIQSSDGPPVDIPSTGIQILHDPDQRTSVVIQLFDSADDMAAAEAPLDQMDTGDTPGTRASIDRCEIKAELSAG
jgi:hypothetical protein